ncbi:MAG: TrkA family potassium uptake protein [Acidobacteriota bacterium]
MGTVFYAITVGAEFLIEGSLRDILGRRAMKRSIDALRDHVIVCGYGRFGKVVAEELSRSGVPFVVVDNDPRLQQTMEAAGRLFIQGSALDEHVLAEAGLARARAVVLGLPRESDNVFIALSVRECSGSILIHARAETDAGVRRLRAAGARQVVSPESLGGQRVAHAIIRPTVVDFIELSAPGSGADVDLEEVVVAPGCEGIPLRDLPSRGVRVAVVAIKRGDDPPRLSPSADDVLRVGDRVVAVGDRENLKRLATLAGQEG